MYTYFIRNIMLGKLADYVMELRTAKERAEKQVIISYISLICDCKLYFLRYLRRISSIRSSPYERNWRSKLFYPQLLGIYLYLRMHICICFDICMVALM